MLIMIGAYGGKACLTKGMSFYERLGLIAEMREEGINLYV